MPVECFDMLSREQLLQTVPSGLFLVDKNQHIVYWNKEAERITGFTSEEALGKHCSFLEGIPGGKRCGLFEPTIPKPITGMPCTARNREGRQIFLLKNVDSLKDEKGEIVGGIESFADVTAQKDLENRLLRSRAEMEGQIAARTSELEEERSRLRSVLDTMADFAYIASEDFRIEFMNRAMVEAFGDLEGKICHQAFYGHSAVCDWCPLQQVVGGETVREERHLTINDRTYEVIHSPLKGADGVMQKLAVFRDITERKKTEELLIEANRELDAFTRSVSHDLRAPLSPIIGYAEILKEEYGEVLDEKGLETLEEIEKQGLKMMAMLEDLLDLARTGQVETPPEPVDVEEAVANILLQLGARTDSAVKTSPLPPLAVPATLVTQLFSNLIGNALRYAGAGGPVEVGGERNGKYIRYHVRDHGPGLPEEERELVFDLFRRGSTAKRSGGTGIGLATVRKIARLFDGRAWVEESPGGGCTFYLEFPDSMG